MTPVHSAIDSPLVKLIVDIWLALKTFYNLKVSICYFWLWVAPTTSNPVIHTSCQSNPNWSILINKLCQFIYDLIAITVNYFILIEDQISSSGTHHTRKQKNAKAIRVKGIETRNLSCVIETNDTEERHICIMCIV